MEDRRHRMTIGALITALRQYQANMQTKTQAVLVYSVVTWIVMTTMKEMLAYADEILPYLYKKYLDETDADVREALFLVTYESCIIIAGIVTIKGENK